jgi:hypothetical protein
MTTSPSPAKVSHSPSNGESLASLPRWRQLLVGLCNTARHLGATLNWRRDPGYEQSIVLHELRMKQLENETNQIEKDILRVRNDSELIRKDSERIEKEIEQLDRENASEKALSALIRQRCFPPESSSIPPTATESDCGSSWS